MRLGWLTENNGVFYQCIGVCFIFKTKQRKLYLSQQQFNNNPETDERYKKYYLIIFFFNV